MSVKISASPRAYMERKGSLDTRRRPNARKMTGVNRIHAYPMSPALPEPGFLHPLAPIADTLVSQIWPHGNEGAQVLS